MHTSYEKQAITSGIPTITHENKVDERLLATLIRSRLLEILDLRHPLHARHTKRRSKDPSLAAPFRSCHAQDEMQVVR
jgi:hypothetical protein